jgi:hypothetical protein
MPHDRAEALLDVAPAALAGMPFVALAQKASAEAPGRRKKASLASVTPGHALQDLTLPDLAGAAAEDLPSAGCSK